MTSKDLIQSIFDKSSERCGFWLGNPTRTAKALYAKYFGLKQVEDTESDSFLLVGERPELLDLELALKFKSDVLFVPSEPGAWKHPLGKTMWDVLPGGQRKSLSAEGTFADVEDPKEIEDFDWPDPKYLDFINILEVVDLAQEKGLAVFGGMWCSFFHVVADFFGMENYFIKMYTHPEVVTATTERVVEFYLEANKRCFDVMGDKLVSAFWGNDFGSQLSSLISIPFFDKFIKPYMRMLIEQMKHYGLKITLHSCGAVRMLIPSFIELGIDALHPLQAKAKDMDAESLAEFKNDLIFVGGVDTQDILPFKTPEEVRNEIKRIKAILGPNLIVSPSHEALLENVSTENVIAMSEAARE